MNLNINYEKNLSLINNVVEGKKIEEEDLRDLYAKFFSDDEKGRIKAKTISLKLSVNDPALLLWWLDSQKKSLNASLKNVIFYYIKKNREIRDISLEYKEMCSNLDNFEQKAVDLVKSVNVTESKDNTEINFVAPIKNIDLNTLSIKAMLGVTNVINQLEQDLNVQYDEDVKVKMVQGMMDVINRL